MYARTRASKLHVGSEWSTSNVVNALLSRHLRSFGQCSSIFVLCTAAPKFVSTRFVTAQALLYKTHINLTFSVLLTASLAVSEVESPGRHLPDHDIPFLCFLNTLHLVFGFSPSLQVLTCQAPLLCLFLSTLRFCFLTEITY